MRRKKIKRVPGTVTIERDVFRIADEIEYIRRRATEHDARVLTIGPVALFSTETGDAWLLEPADHLAVRIARDGVPEHFHFEETDTRFGIGWKGKYEMDGDAFVYIDDESGRITTILGYPTRKLSQLGC